MKVGSEYTGLAWPQYDSEKRSKCIPVVTVKAAMQVVKMKKMIHSGTHMLVDLD